MFGVNSHSPWNFSSFPKLNVKNRAFPSRFWCIKTFRQTKNRPLRLKYDGKLSWADTLKGLKMLPFESKNNFNCYSVFFCQLWATYVGVRCGISKWVINAMSTGIHVIYQWVCVFEAWVCLASGQLTVHSQDISPQRASIVVNVCLNLWFLLSVAFKIDLPPRKSQLISKQQPTPHFVSGKCKRQELI